MDSITIHMFHNPYRRDYQPYLSREIYFEKGKELYRSHHHLIPDVAQALQDSRLRDVQFITGDEERVHVMVTNPEAWKDIEGVVLDTLIEKFWKDQPPPKIEVRK